jgi:hypothetical protein
LRKCFAQDKKLTYTQFEVTLAFTGNPKSGEVDQRTNIKNLGSFQTGMGTKLVMVSVIKKMEFIVD